MKKFDLKEMLLITAATAVVAFSVYYFLVPADIPLGSVSGLAIVLNRLSGLSVSLWTLILNAGLLVIGFILIGPEFGSKTVYTSLLMPLFMGLFEKISPDSASIMGDPILDAVCFLFICSVGLTILFNLNASSGGLDIVAKILNKYLHIELGLAMSVSGMCAALLSALCYDTRTVILSVLGTYLSGVVLDHFIFSFGGKKKVCILSKNYEKVRDFILNDINRGATLYEAKGAKEGEMRWEINTIVDKSEYRRIISYLQKNDPSAFVTVYSVSEVLDNSKRVPKSEK